MMRSRAQAFTPLAPTAELTMNEFSSGKADPLAGWLLPGALNLAGVPAAALIGRGVRNDRPGENGEPTAPKSFVDSPRRETVLAVETVRIVPVNALERARPGHRWRVGR